MTAPDPEDDPLDPLPVEDLPSPPAGAPPGFRERLTLHLKTVAPDVLRAAEADFRGQWASPHLYIAARIAAQLPPAYGWLPGLCDPLLLRRGYEGGRLIIWTIGLPDGTCLVFESLRNQSPFRLLEP